MELEINENKQSIISLHEYKNSKEFQKIIAKFNNKSERLRKKVLSDLKKWKCSKTMKFWEDDKLVLISNILEELLLEIKSDSPWAEIFKKNLTKNIENIEFNLVRQYQWFATPVYTEKCMDLVKAWEYEFIEKRFDSTIDSFRENKWEKKLDIYD